MKRLIILRHAKAEQVPGKLDHDRALTGRGERDARRAGTVLGGMGLVPDLVLCSPAVRTRQTAELALAEFAPDARVYHEPEIYLAYPDDLLALIQRTDPDVATLLLVAHNPGSHELFLSLTGTPADDDPGFPTCAFAVVETDTSWEHLWPGEGRTAARWTPKDGRI
ncbi:histidine phosphatase family protein [Thermopolyspora sp. NPDC052614]|uniref:SixA phosphatase family protein n=1 Tax=Thermopolyspora sp. NPDC052614 TaxID=3155682 RepID=UPI003415A613